MKRGERERYEIPNLSRDRRVEEINQSQGQASALGFRAGSPAPAQQLDSPKKNPASCKIILGRAAPHAENREEAFEIDKKRTSEILPFQLMRPFRINQKIIAISEASVNTQRARDANFES